MATRRPQRTDRQLLEGAQAHLRKQWARIALRGVHFADKHERLDSLYRVRDPWEMDTDAQRFRFRETNRLVEATFGHVGSILEIGSGEGHQSEHLQALCDELVGVDVSARAVSRAGVRCPDASFVVGDVFSSDLLAGRRFDLVVACEVLYYVKDIASALDRLRQLADSCVVTYYARPAEVLDRYVRGLDGVETTRLSFGESSWTVAWWRTRSS